MKRKVVLFLTFLVPLIAHSQGLYLFGFQPVTISPNQEVVFSIVAEGTLEDLIEHGDEVPIVAAVTEQWRYHQYMDGIYAQYDLPYNYTLPSGDIVLPDSVSYSFTDGSGNVFSGTAPVRIISNNAFYQCNVTSLSIPRTITQIGIKICDSTITSLNYNADSARRVSFRLNNNYTYDYHPEINNPGRSFDSLNVLTIGPDVTFIDEFLPHHVDTMYFNALRCHTIKAGIDDLQTLYLGDNIEYIPRNLCKGSSNITSVTIPEGVRFIGACAFHGTNITSITIPSSVEYIEACAFYSPSLRTVNINARNLERNHSEWEDLTDYWHHYMFGISYNRHSKGMFACSSYNPEDPTQNELPCSPVTNLIFGDSVSVIPNYFLYGNTAITSLTIPKSVERISTHAFKNCTSLQEIHSLNPTPFYVGEAFDSVPYDIPVYIPCGSTESYTYSWYPFTNFIESSSYIFNVSSSDETMGTVQIVNAPTCTSPAVIQANPNTGYHFVQWNDGNTDNPRTLTVESDTTIIGYFASNSGTESVDDIEDTKPFIYTVNSSIIVDNTGNEEVIVYDIKGRMIFNKKANRCSIDVPSSGIYIVKVGHQITKKVLVVQ